MNSSEAAETTIRADAAVGTSVTDAAARTRAPEASAEERVAPKRRSNLAGTLVRLAVSVAALALIFTRVPVGGVARAIVSLDPFWAVMAFVAVYACIVVSAFKWMLLLNAGGYRASMPRLTRHYLVGLFFNSFLPTSVGGDVVRAWDVGKDVGDAAEGAASVIAERLIASLALGLTAALGLPFAHGGAQAAFAVAVIIVGSAALVAVFLAPSRSERMMRSAMGERFEGAADWAARAVYAVNATLRRQGSVVAVLLLSVCFQVFVACVNYCIFRALGTPVGLGPCVVFTSVISAVTMIPVSISGHGIREAGYAYFFGIVGVPATVAVTGSLLFFAVVAVATLPGAVFFAMGRRS